MPLTIPALSSAIYEDAAIASLLPPGINPTTVAVTADLEIGKNLVSSNLIYLLPTKRIHLAYPDVKMRISAVAGGVKIQLSSLLLARDVYLSLDTLKSSRPNRGNVNTFADNFFDLLPGAPRDILLHTAMSIDQTRGVLRITSLAEAFAPTTPTARCETTVCAKTMKEPS